MAGKKKKKFYFKTGGNFLNKDFTVVKAPEDFVNLEGLANIYIAFFNKFEFKKDKSNTRGSQNIQNMSEHKYLRHYFMQ